MTLKAISYIGLFIVFGASASYGSVYKLRSYQCQNREQNVRHGSVTVVALQESIHLVSAAHVPYPADHNEGYCHDLICHSSQCSRDRFPLKLIRMNVLNDLVEFEFVEQGVEDDFSKAALSLTDLDQPFSQELSAVGVSFNNTAVTTDDHAFAINNNSERHQFALLPTMIEFHSRLDRGASGGAIIDKSTGHLIGIISSQDLRIFEAGNLPEIIDGGPLPVKQLDEDKVLLKVELAVDSVTLRGWLNNPIDGDVRYELTDFLDNQRSIIFDGVKFSEVYKTIENTASVGSNAEQIEEMIVPAEVIGGATAGDGVGIGGHFHTSGDGVGIGGADADQRLLRHILISHSETRGQSWPFDQTDTKWFNRLKKRLLVGPIRTSKYMIKGRTSLHQTRNLLDYFNQIRLGRTPIVTAATNLTNPNISVELDRLQTAHQILLSKYASNKLIAAFLKEVEILYLELESDIALSSQIQCLDNLQNGARHREARHMLFNRDFEHSVELIGQLHKIRKKLHQN